MFGHICVSLGRPPPAASRSACRPSRRPTATESARSAMEAKSAPPPAPFWLLFLASSFSAHWPGTYRTMPGPYRAHGSNTIRREATLYLSTDTLRLVGYLTPAMSDHQGNLVALHSAQALSRCAVYDNGGYSRVHTTLRLCRLSYPLASRQPASLHCKSIFCAAHAQLVCSPFRTFLLTSMT